MPLTEAVKTEFKRKAFHSLSILYGLAYYFLERKAVVEMMGGLTCAEGLIEFGRLYAPALNARLMGWFGGIHRAEEKRKVSGIFWTLLGCWMTIFLFRDRAVVLCALGYLAFSDAAAGLCGVAFGRHEILGKKSLEGSLACFAASVAVGSMFLPLPGALAGAAVVTLVEILPLPFNDNLWIPLLSALFLSLKFFG